MLHFAKYFDLKASEMVFQEFIAVF